MLASPNLKSSDSSKRELNSFLLGNLFSCQAFLANSFYLSFIFYFSSFVFGLALPTNAMPTSADFNAPTSFEPSPHIITLSYYFIIFMNISFYLGEVRAATVIYFIILYKLLFIKYSIVVPSQVIVYSEYYLIISSFIYSCITS